MQPRRPDIRILHLSEGVQLALAGPAHVRREGHDAGTGPPTSFAWVIDSVGPTAAITQTPGNPTSNRSATFAFSASEAGSFASLTAWASAPAARRPRTRDWGTVCTRSPSSPPIASATPASLRRSAGGSMALLRRRPSPRRPPSERQRSRQRSRSRPASRLASSASSTPERSRRAAPEDAHRSYTGGPFVRGAGRGRRGQRRRHAGGNGWTIGAAPVATRRTRAASALSLREPARG